MTYEEAIRTIKDIICENNTIKPNMVVFEQEKEALHMAIDALEKQIPKKTLPETEYYGNGRCARCNVVFIDKSTKYCGNCGQRIDWGDEE